MKANSITRWRARLGMNKSEAARALGMSRQTLEAYERAYMEPPQYVLLACAALEEGLKPISKK
jgi:DNA-binding XRE family transcriptional regulator